jgi:hypothetical protein
MRAWRLRATHENTLAIRISLDGDEYPASPPCHDDTPGNPHTGRDI